MAFLAHEASVDLIGNTATVVFRDPPSSRGGASVTIHFNFEPVPGEELKSPRVVQEAKQILQQAVEEILIRKV